MGRTTRAKGLEAKSKGSKKPLKPNPSEGLGIERQNKSNDSRKKRGRSRSVQNGEDSPAQLCNKSQRVENAGIMQAKDFADNNNAIPETSGLKGTPGHQPNVVQKTLFMERNIGEEEEYFEEEADVAHDGIMVTVHAPDGEFEDVSGEEEMEEDGETVEEESSDEETEVQLKSSIHQVQKGQGCPEVAKEKGEESMDELMAKYSTNLNFCMMVQQMVKNTINTGSAAPDGEYNGGSECLQNCDSINLTPVINKQGTNKAPQVKSPSDTTIYAPGLQRSNAKDMVEKCDMLEKISNFVESVHAGIGQSTPPCRSTGPDWQNMNRETLHGGPSGEGTSGSHSQPRQSDEADRARKLADKLILDAETFNSSIAAPQGKLPQFENLTENRLIRDNFPQSSHNPIVDGDDDFFHLTCHVEPNLRMKIERGEFVDLDKLLPKERYPHKLGEDGRLEMINHEGVTYFVPAVDKESKVNNLKKWGQAFRVYVAIYCKQNPERSAEIWQYIYVIHMAASTFTWENVVWYDYTFGQLTAAKPFRSWAKIYNQFRNLAMRNPLSNNFPPHNSGSSGPKGKGVKKFRDWRDNCCWIFNHVGRCTRANCRFENHCSYCGAYNHGISTCRKAGNGKKSQSKHVGHDSNPNDAKINV